MKSQLENESASPPVFNPGDIDAQLARLLESHHFCHSQRYPALLKHLVQQVQLGNAARLKERILGIEVFHRSPDYDTSLDPVVRVTAGEIRKRIAQYYHEPEHIAELRIDLPIGSYIPRFLPARASNQETVTARSPTQQETEVFPLRTSGDLSAWDRSTPSPQGGAPGPSLVSLVDTNSSSHSHDQLLPSSVEAAPSVLNAGSGAGLALFRKHNLLLLLLALLTGAGLTSVAFLTKSWIVSARTRALHRLWAPVISSQIPLLFVVGDHSLDDEGHPMGIAPVVQSSADSVLTQMNRRSQVPFDDTVSLDKIHMFLSRDDRRYQDKGAGEATLEDLRAGPVVLFAGFDNRWTVHLSQQLRFRLQPDLDHNLASIVDSKDPAHRWTVNFAEPVNEFVSDYGIVARYFDPLLEQNVMLVAGIGSMGTAAASEFVTEERFSREIVRAAPAGWTNGNFEIVLNAPVIDGHVGPPRIVASTYW